MSDENTENQAKFGLSDLLIIVGGIAVISLLFLGIRELHIYFETRSCNTRWTYVEHEYVFNKGFLFGGNGVCLVEVAGEMVPEKMAIFSNQPVVVNPKNP